MAPFSIFPSWILSKIFKSKLIYEVKDIWPLTLIEVGGISSNHPFIVLMRWFEKFAVKNSDTVVSNLPNYNAHVKDNLKVHRAVEWISNGVDLAELKQNEPLDKEFGSRIRFRSGFEFPLTNETGNFSPYFVVFNEVFLLIEKNFPYQYNQNWTFIGFQQKISSKMNLLTGFQRNSIDKGGSFTHKNIWSSILFYRL